MEKFTQFKWRPMYIAYLLVLACITFLFFTGAYETGFANLVREADIGILISEMTLRKTVLFVLDISLMVIAFTPLPNEDERVEKVRNYALKNVFMLSMLTAAMLGLMVNSSLSILILPAFILSYYILVFRLSLYRDPVFVYMSDEELRTYARSNKKYNLFSIMEMSIAVAIANAMGDKYHSAQLVWIIILVNVYILALIKTVYFSFKG